MSFADYDRADSVKKGIERVLSRLKSEPDPRQPCEARSPARPSATSVAVAPDRRWPLPGLAPMTRVRTSFGDVHAVALRKGDLVRVRSGEFRPIVWLNRVLLDEDFLATMPDSNPIRLRAGSLGAQLPAVDVMMSPRQIVAPTPKSSVFSCDMLTRLQSTAEKNGAHSSLTPSARPLHPVE